MRSVSQRALRLAASLASVGAVTWVAHSLTPVNATTIGFVYLLLVLVIATAWGFVEASVASIAATLLFNFFFLPPRRPGQAFSIEGMTGFVSTVEFSDGGVWIPSRSDLANPTLQSVMAPSPEELRLVQLYRRKGLNALVEDLKKF